MDAATVILMALFALGLGYTLTREILRAVREEHRRQQARIMSARVRAYRMGRGR